MRDDLRQDMIDVSATHWWFEGRKYVLEAVLRAYRRKPENRILEVGCGDGNNFPWLKNHGTLSALELAEDLRMAAEKRQIAKVHAGFLPDGLPEQLEPASFDIIAAFDMLEHIAAEHETLESLKNLLAPEGRIFISVPAYPWLWSAHDEALHHQRRYTRTSLINALKQAGFQVEYISYFNSLLFPLALIARLTDKLCGRNKSLGMAVPAAPINRLLREVYALERFIIPRYRLPFGLSLIAVAKV